MKESYFQFCAGCESGVGIGWMGGGGRNPPMKKQVHFKIYAVKTLTWT